MEENGPAIRVEKPSSRPTNAARQKLCATCGRPFDLQPGQKFFDCPDCYQSKMSAQRYASTNMKKTRVLTRIKCMSCGAAEFVAFVPEDPETVLCRRCFASLVKEQREQREQKARL